jgi:hypothetical protein
VRQVCPRVGRTGWSVEILGPTQPSGRELAAGALNALAQL